MIITDQFPIAVNRLAQQDQTLSFAGMTWQDYEKLVSEKSSGYRCSFADGVITIMSPSQNHELLKDFIFLLVVSYCDFIELDYYPTSSTTLKDLEQQIGKEPDCSFCFTNLKTTPDLVIEVVFSSGGLSDLKKYQALGVKEVWFWINDCLEIYALRDDAYQQESHSLNFPQLEARLLSKYIRQTLTKSPRLLKNSFLQEFA